MTIIRTCAAARKRCSSPYRLRSGRSLAACGPVVPGTYTVVDDVGRNGYQFAGVGGQLGTGIDIGLFCAPSAVAR